MEAAIKKAEERVTFVSKDKEALRAYQMRQMALSDYTSGINYARREGIKEGVKEGVKEGLRKVAKNLKAAGEPVGKIASVTGLPIDEIEKL
jgi:predicted transposase/invertase (TIGR01784 family)